VRHGGCGAAAADGVADLGFLFKMEQQHIG